MDPHTLWLYTLAFASLVWGVFGLRAALGVIAASAVLSMGYRLVPAESAFTGILLIGYPLYWAAAFFLFGFVRPLPLPGPSSMLRLALGFFVALAFAALANWGEIGHDLRLLHAVYVAPVEERPRLIEREFANASYAQVCMDSEAALMRLAMGAKDHKVLAALLEAFGRCYSASSTMEEVVLPVLDKGDMEAFELLMDSGLKPGTLVSGSPYRGSVFAHTALVSGNRELVRALVRRYPEDSRHLPFLGVLLNDLNNDRKTGMLRLLMEEGIVPPGFFAADPLADAPADTAPAAPADAPLSVPADTAPAAPADAPLSAPADTAPAAPADTPSAASADAPPASAPPQGPPRNTVQDPPGE